jgi:hypothetical protein
MVVISEVLPCEARVWSRKSDAVLKAGDVIMLTKLRREVLYFIPTSSAPYFKYHQQAYLGTTQLCL